MESKVCVITGSNSGIGKITAIELAKKGYEIIMLVRDSEKSRIVYEEIKSESGGKIVLKYIDLASLDSIRKIADEIKAQYERIDILINNAGIFKRKYEESVDSYEISLAVNYLAVYALTNHLLPLLKKSYQGRIINLTSELYKRGKINIESDFSMKKFDGSQAYANSKLLVIYFTKELAKRLETHKITVNCVHPGVVGTDVFREYSKWFAKLMNLLISKPEDGAKPSIFLATSAALNKTTGKYFYKSKQKETAEVANNTKLLKEIWLKTEELTGVKCPL